MRIHEQANFATSIQIVTSQFHKTNFSNFTTLETHTHESTPLTTTIISYLSKYIKKARLHTAHKYRCSQYPEHLNCDCLQTIGKHTCTQLANVRIRNIQTTSQLRSFTNTYNSIGGIFFEIVTLACSISFDAQFRFVLGRPARSQPCVFIELCQFVLFMFTCL